MAVTKSKIIALNEIKDFQTFIDKAGSVDGEVLVQTGYYIINGKSVMGMISIATALTKGVTVIYPANAHDFELFLEEVEIQK